MRPLWCGSVRASVGGAWGCMGGNGHCWGECGERVYQGVLGSVGVCWDECGEHVGLHWAVLG